MNYKKTYISPLGIIYMRSDGEYLTGLWFEKSRDDLKHQGDFEEKDLSIFNETSKWLDIDVYKRQVFEQVKWGIYMLKA